jgi:uncharacterized membrane protein YeiB
VPSSLRPLAPGERLVVLDAIRGLALYGVLLVNVVTAFRVSLFRWLTSFHVDRSAANRVADDVVALVFEQKAMVVFSLLFGIGMGIVADRVRARSLSITAFFSRRYAALALIGIVHRSSGPKGSSISADSANQWAMLAASSSALGMRGCCSSPSTSRGYAECSASSCRRGEWP